MSFRSCFEIKFYAAYWDHFNLFKDDRMIYAHRHFTKLPVHHVFDKKEKRIYPTLRGYVKPYDTLPEMVGTGIELTTRRVRDLAPTKNITWL